jgi:iron complex transport system permease protein
MTRRALGLLAGVGLLALTVLLSIAVGARSIPAGVVWDLLWRPDGSDLSATVHNVRIPRTLLGLVVGVALGLAGVLMQALTRNPLADPGIFGINVGAALAVVGAVVMFGFTDPTQYVWFAFVGAAITATVVYLLGSTGPGPGANAPTRLALAGVAIAAAIHAIMHGFTILNASVYDEIRFWNAGAFAGRDLAVVTTVAPFVLAGSLLTLVLSRWLNAIALGEDTARCLGVRIGLARVLGALAVLLLCGAATAGAGPIAFVGLAVPHLVRPMTGPDHRWLLAYALVCAPALLLLADVIGRVVARPSEVPVAIVMALIGAPVFIVLVRRRKLVRR